VRGQTALALAVESGNRAVSGGSWRFSAVLRRPAGDFSRCFAVVEPRAGGRRTAIPASRTTIEVRRVLADRLAATLSRG